MMKKDWTSLFEDYLVMAAVDMKYPIVSAANIVKRMNDLTRKIYLSKNQVLGNLFAAPIVKQNPNEQRKVPIKKR
jgi:hypothetical protein